MGLIFIIAGQRPAVNAPPHNCLQGRTLAPPPAPSRKGGECECSKERFKFALSSPPFGGLGGCFLSAGCGYRLTCSYANIAFAGKKQFKLIPQITFVYICTSISYKYILKINA